MIFLERGETTGGSNPILNYWFAKDGILVDPDDVNRFKILDSTGVKTFPADPDEWSTVIDKLSDGHFAPQWDTSQPGLVAQGAYFLIVDTIHDGVALEFSIPFDILPTNARRFMSGCSFALLTDLRSAGVSDSTVPDNEALQALCLAARQIEIFTDRQFGVRGKTIEVNGRGSPDLLIDEPICALSSLQILTHAFGSEAVVDDQDLTDVEIYNRHLRGLNEPDDRNNPKLSFRRLHDHLGNRYEETRPLFPHHIFPLGQQNVVLEGAFGYTEPDGSPVGGTPLLIRRAAVMLASQFATPAVQQIGSVSASRGPIVEERTRDQAVKYAKPSSLGGAQPGPFTGDAAIDNLILPYVKPATIGAA